MMGRTVKGASTKTVNPKTATIMESFPKLQPHQIALIRADINTGHVLDEEYKIAVNDAQKVYTVFESTEDALNASKRILTENISIEVIIYNANQVLMHYLTTSDFTL